MLMLASLLALRAQTLRADDAEDRLRLLGSPEHEGHAAALAGWERRQLEERVAILRRALVSEDIALATLAAEAVGAEHLDSREIRRQMSLLMARPTSTFESPTKRRAWGIGAGVRAWGSPDLVPFFRQAAADQTGACDYVSLDSWHRVMRAHHVEGLVPLLDEGSPKVFRRVLWHVAMCGEYDREDRYRAVVARGLLYGLKRLRAERAGKPVPPLDEGEIEVDSPPGGGLPEAYVTLAEAYYPRKATWKIRLDADGPPGDLEIRSAYFWLRRWARDLTPSAKDLPYLQDLVEDAGMSDHMLLRWAVGHMASMSGEGGLDRVKAWAKGYDPKAAYAAAALAERGEPQRFLELLDAANATTGDKQQQVRIVLRDLLWSVDRAAARERWVADVLASEPPTVERGNHLDADGRFRKERFDGVEVTAQDMTWIENALWERGASALTLAWFYGAVWPEGLTRERTEVLLQRLHDVGSLPWEDRTPEDLLRLLAMIEVRDEPRLVTLLHRWVETQQPIRSEVLRWLARLGDTEHAAAMIEDWGHWDYGERWILGRVEAETVREFLETQAEGEDAEFVPPAVFALLTQAGLPDACVLDLLYHWNDDLDVEPLPEIRRLLREGDAPGAVLRAAREASIHLLGLVHDDRARAMLNRFQVDRHLGNYLGATAGLAIAGDAEAGREIRAFLEDDRIWMIENLADEMWSYLAEPWMVEHWVERLDSNCCLGWRSMVALKSIYPTIPFDDGWGGAGTRRTREWIESHTWKHSRLLDGLVQAGP